MIRMSSLRNCPVICQNRQIGFLQSATLDDRQIEVRALVVARGLRGKCILPAKAVEMISREFILAAYTQKYDRQCEANAYGFVRDTDGLLIGRTTDYALDDTTLSIAAIEVRRGYLPPESHERIWFFSYVAGENGELTVPAAAGWSQDDR